MADIKWHGDAFEKKLFAHVKRNLAAACIALVNHAKTLISIEGTGKVRERDSRGKFKRTKLIYNANPSSPGEPPHVQTGRLRGSVAFEVLTLGSMIGRVGTNLKYGRWLELGTKKMAARPWLRRSLLELKAAIAAIICRPMP